MDVHLSLVFSFSVCIDDFTMDCKYADAVLSNNPISIYLNSSGGLFFTLFCVNFESMLSFDVKVHKVVKSARNCSKM